MRPCFKLETTQAQVWQCGDEVTFNGAGDPRARGEIVRSVGSGFRYTEVTFLSFCWRALVCIITA